MKCCSCKRPIAAGVDAAKMIVEYRQADGTTTLYGYQMPAGPVTAATGQILRAWHHKHFHIARKREARGDAVTGRVLAGGPTGYDIEQATAAGTEHLSTRLGRLAEVARRIGKGLGDAHVIEAARADEHGGPYPHAHHFALEPYQLQAHLHYAHGADLATLATTMTLAHGELHADMQAQREAEQQTRDWREQFTADL